MYGRYRDMLMSRGYVPVPLYGKKTGVSGFLEPGYIPPKGYVQCNTALLCGAGTNPLCGIDIDVTEPTVSQVLLDKTIEVLGSSVYRIGQHPKSLIVYRYDTAGIRKKFSDTYSCGQVEILGFGQHFISHGIHSITGEPYYWPEKDIADTEVTELPVVTEQGITKLIGEYHKIFTACGYQAIEKKSLSSPNHTYDPLDVLDRKEPIGIDLKELKNHLSCIDPDCSRNQWRNIGMALHHELKGSDNGFELWDSWSSTGTKYNQDEMKSQWQSYGRYTGEPLTARYILKISSSKKDIPVLESKSKFNGHVYIPSNDNRPKQPEPLLELNGRRILSRGSLSLISAPAGIGKTQVMSAICSAVAEPFELEIDTLGFDSTALTAMFIDTEQPRYNHHLSWERFIQRTGYNAHGILPDKIQFRLISEIIKLKDRQEFLLDVLNSKTPPSLLLVDGLGDFVRDVNDATECVPFVYALTALLKQKDIGMLTTLHVNPSTNADKMRGVLGSELWRKAEFSAIIQRLDDNTRALTTDYTLGKNRSDFDKITAYFKWCSEKEMMITCAPPICDMTTGDIEILISGLLEKNGAVPKAELLEMVPASKKVVNTLLTDMYNKRLLDISKHNKQICITYIGGLNDELRTT